MKRHTPVLLENVLEVLKPQKGEIFADMTAGYGGHAQALLDAVGPSGHGYLYDKDPQAILALQEKFKSNSNITITQLDFGQLDWQKDVPSVDMILADIGVSSPQIDQPERGFSFMHDGPLDMRMNQDQDFSAYDIVNTYSQKQLADILYEYGEERQSRRIAAAITASARVEPIKTTAQLADIISREIGKSGRIHPATKSFQALRIAVNDELGSLQSALDKMPQNLSPKGRIAIISFHSLEDRIVKQAFKALCTAVRDEFGQIVSEPLYRAVTKKPITGDKLDKSNPRARSAKLRAVEKIN